MRWFKSLLCIFLLTLLCAVSVSAAEKNGLVKADGKTYYYENGSKVTGKFLKVKNNGKNEYYYFTGDGSAYNQGYKKITSLYEVNKDGKVVKTDSDVVRYYFFQKNGKAFTDGMLKYYDHDGNNAYGYFYKDGHASKSSIKRVDKVTFTYKSHKVRVTKEYDQTRTYYLKSNGKALISSWKTIKGKKYYFSNTGAAFTGKHKINKREYTFNDLGVLIKGNGILVCIDPGHQRHQNTGKEPNGPGSSEMKQKVASGTQGVSTNIPEYVLTLEVSRKLEKILKDKGYTVLMTRKDHDVDISNVERSKIANKAGADIFVRVHANGSSSSSVNGVECYNMSKKNPYNAHLYSKSRKLSEKICNAFANKTGAKNRGAFDVDNMTGINWCEVPVTIVEMGYMSNPAEDEKMAKDSYRSLMAEGMAEGIDDYFGF